jgi:hypothetical protein
MSIENIKKDKINLYNFFLNYKNKNEWLINERNND